MIALSRVEKLYRMGKNHVKALSDVTLTINRGEFVSIVGTSGSGKSTLMNIIGCLDTATKGNYYLEGQEISTLSQNDLSNIRNKKIGFVFQGFNLIPTLTALENVELPLQYRRLSFRERRALATEALIHVGLSDRMHHRPCELSGGQQQRVAIARAIAASPGIILADEPCGNLDSVSSASVMKTLQDLNQLGKTVVLITHDDNAAKVAHRTIRLKDGQIISMLPPSE
jgi:putative ABC transport system ATP-binding protein